MSFDVTTGAAHTNLNALLLPTGISQFEPENFFADVVTNGLNTSTTGVLVHTVRSWKDHSLT